MTVHRFHTGVARSRPQLLKRMFSGPCIPPVGLQQPNRRHQRDVFGDRAGAHNWNGGAIDPETGMFYVVSHSNPILSGMVPFSNAPARRLPRRHPAGTRISGISSVGEIDAGKPRAPRVRRVYRSPNRLRPHYGDRSNRGGRFAGGERGRDRVTTGVEKV